LEPNPVGLETSRLKIVNLCLDRHQSSSILCALFSNSRKYQTLVPWILGSLRSHPAKPRISLCELFSDSFRGQFVSNSATQQLEGTLVPGLFYLELILNTFNSAYWTVYNSCYH